MNAFEHHLEKYATLAIQKGVNLQTGQLLFIQAPITSRPFVHILVRKAYEAGAKNVHVEWSDDDLTRIKFDHAPDEAFSIFPKWLAEGREQLAKEKSAFITIKSTDPDLLKGVEPKKIAAANRAAGEALGKFRTYIQSDRVSWLVISTPSPGWAKKVFPQVTEEEAERKLWEAIFKAVRVDTDNPIEAWNQHNKKLHEKAKILNEKKYKTLHYQAPGTDLTIDLPEGHIWMGGGSPNEDGIDFIANMPTEEVFTVPHKYGVNGYVTNTKPLNYSGNIIDQFTLHFERGRITQFEAKEGKEVLERLINTDEGSHYLGEVALVPHSSPISQSNILFYNTLFDENASSHLAIGSAYSFCIENGTNMSKDETEKRGLNNSIVHVDFMIGSEEMDIDGTLPNGNVEAIMRQGEWVI